MTEVAVVGFAHAPHVRRTEGTTNGVEMLMPCFAELYADLGIEQTDIGFWCSGSSDYLAGRAFSFLSAIDSIGAVPPINESHVEMDAAWALYEAYIKILTGSVDTALVYGFGKSSAGRAAPGACDADRPVHGGAAGARRRIDRRPAGPARPGLRQVDRRADGAGGAGLLRGCRAHRFGKTRQKHRRTACPAVLRRSVAPPRHCADHRRRIGDRAGRGRPSQGTAGEPGLDHRHRAPHRDAGARRPRPDHVAVDGGVGLGRDGRRQPVRSTSPNSMHHSPISS